jgi:hypothetical protein
MNELPDRFNFLAWHDSIVEFMRWDNPSRDYTYHLLKITQRAYDAKSKYWLQDKMMSREPLDLTDLYEKVKIISILATKDLNEEETSN